MQFAGRGFFLLKAEEFFLSDFYPHGQFQGDSFTHLMLITVFCHLPTWSQRVVYLLVPKMFTWGITFRGSWWLEISKGLGKNEDGEFHRWEGCLQRFHQEILWLEKNILCSEKKIFYINIRKKEKFDEEKNIKSNDYVFLYKRVVWW